MLGAPDVDLVLEVAVRTDGDPAPGIEEGRRAHRTLPRWQSCMIPARGPRRKRDRHGLGKRRGRCYLRAASATPSLLGDSLAVELPALTRAALVRIQVPQPPPRKPLRSQQISRSRGAMVGVLAGFVVHAVFSHRRSRSFTVATLVMGVAFAAFVLTTVSTDLAEAESSQFNTISSRETLQTAAWNEWLDSPILGQGLRFLIWGVVCLW